MSSLFRLKFLASQHLNSLTVICCIDVPSVRSFREIDFGILDVSMLAECSGYFSVDLLLLFGVPDKVMDCEMCNCLH